MAERYTNLDRRLDALRSRCCTGKTPLGRSAATRIAAASRNPHDEHHNPLSGPLEAYRCPFADDDHPDAAWHVGHAMSMFRLEETARLLRARSGNAPGPVDPEAAERVGRQPRHERKRRRRSGHRS